MLHPNANSSRNNNYFESGGTLAPVSQAPLARRTSPTWEPPDVDKGWIARSACYMATRYDGTETDTTDLILVETPPESVTSNPPQMGRKSVFLRWNRLHPPTEWERRRNQLVFDLYQHNRNPFIDHPEFVDAIYEAPLGRETRLTWRYRHFTLTELKDEAVAGDLADPDGDGLANLLEFALGANPRVGEPAIAPLLQADSPGKIKFVFRRQRDRDLSNLSYTVESAASPAGPWQAPTSLVETGVATSGTIETVTTEFDSAGPATFARLRISQ